MTFFAISAYGQAIKGKEYDIGECKGLIQLISSAGDVEEFKENQLDIDVKATKAILKGCGCYRLYQRKDKRGRSYYVNKIGEHSIPLRKIGSLAKVPCSREAKAMPVWSIALIVTGLVVVVGFIVVLVYKRKTRYHESLPTIDQ